MLGAVRDGNRVSNILQLAALSLPLSGAAAVIWDGPDTTFTKPAFADWTQPASQDQLTAGVALTRASTAGLFNIVLEPSYAGTSPAGTTWAFQGLNSNPTSAGEMTAANFANLNFSSWSAALGGQGQLAANILNRPGVVHLVSEDIYLDITFSAWASGSAGGGGFSYTRSTPIPEPEHTAAMAVGLLGLTIGIRAWRRQRNSLKHHGADSQGAA